MENNADIFDPTRVVVTGAGAVSAFGGGCEALWAGIAAGRDGIVPIERFPVKDYSSHTGAIVPGRNRVLPPGQFRDLCLDYAVAAAEEALDHAHLHTPETRASGIALVVGTSMGDTIGQIHTPGEALCRRLGIAGPCMTVSTACASSTNAIGLAMDLLRDGSSEMILVGGVDIVSETVFAGFNALGVLSSGKCAPFGLPMGTTLGEGAGFLLLERADHAVRRGAEVLGFLCGYGLSSDAYHETAPDPTGSGVSRAIKGALHDAGLSPMDVGYINAHGSGTEANDRAEWQAIQRVFGDYATALPVSSVKGHLGHAQGAAGVLELITTLLAMRNGVVPPTLRCSTRRPFGPVDPVSEGRPRPQRYHCAVCTNSAFGGANAAIIASSRRVPSRPSAPQYPAVLGLGVIGPPELGTSDAGCWIRGMDPAAEPVQSVDIHQLIPSADPRDLDEASHYLSVASALALADAGIRVRGPLRERSGLFVGTTCVSASGTREFQRSIDERNLNKCSVIAFARLVLNAPAGSCSKLLSLKGPTSTVTIGAGSGLMALVYAASFLSSHHDVDLIAAGGVDAFGCDGRPDRSDGAACIALGRPAMSPPGMLPGPVVAGWGIAGAEAVLSAAECALDMRGMKFCEVDVVAGSSESGAVDALKAGFPRAFHRPAPKTLHDAFGSAWTAVEAVRAIRAGAVRTALVVSDAGASASCAILFSASDDTYGY